MENLVEKMKTLSDIKLSVNERQEFDNIANNQPVFAGNLSSSNDAKLLIEKGLVMRYEGEYVLTELGKLLKSNLKAATDLRDSGIIYKNRANEKSI